MNKAFKRLAALTVGFAFLSTTTVQAVTLSTPERVYFKSKSDAIIGFKYEEATKSINPVRQQYKNIISGLGYDQDMALEKVWVEMPTGSIQLRMDKMDGGKILEDTVNENPTEVKISADYFIDIGTDGKTMVVKDSSGTVIPGAVIDIDPYGTGNFTIKDSDGEPITSNSVKYNLTNIKDAVRTNLVVTGTTLSATFEAISGYELPQTITVTMAGTTLPSSAYVYDASMGTLTVSKVTGAIEITVAAVEKASSSDTDSTTDTSSDSASTSDISDSTDSASESSSSGSSESTSEVASGSESEEASGSEVASDDSLNPSEVVITSGELKLTFAPTGGGTGTTTPAALVVSGGAWNSGNTSDSAPTVITATMSLGALSLSGTTTTAAALTLSTMIGDATGTITSGTSLSLLSDGYTVGYAMNTADSTPTNWDNLLEDISLGTNTHIWIKVDSDYDKNGTADTSRYYKFVITYQE